VTTGFQQQFRDKVLGVNAHVIVLKSQTTFAEYRDVMKTAREIDPEVLAVQPFIFAEMLATNCHVLAKAKRVVVRHEKASFEARLDLWDTARDLCQLRAAGLPAAPVRIAPTASVVVGQNVYAIGTPRGLELTMSAGLVSSLRRNAAGQVVLVQTSASISGGSSGGGLFDDSGALVGLTTLGSVTGDAQNLNFAIPADWIVDLPERHSRLSKKPLPGSKRSDDVTSSAPTTSTAAPAANR